MQHEWRNRCVKNFGRITSNTGHVVDLGVNEMTILRYQRCGLIIMLFNDAVSAAELTYRRMRCEDYDENIKI